MRAEKGEHYWKDSESGVTGTIVGIAGAVCVIGTLGLCGEAAVATTTAAVEAVEAADLAASAAVGAEVTTTTAAGEATTVGALTYGAGVVGQGVGAATAAVVDETGVVGLGLLYAADGGTMAGYEATMAMAEAMGYESMEWGLVAGQDLGEVNAAAAEQVVAASLATDAAEGAKAGVAAADGAKARAATSAESPPGIKNEDENGVVKPTDDTPAGGEAQQPDKEPFHINTGEPPNFIKQPQTCQI